MCAVHVVGCKHIMVCQLYSMTSRVHVRLTGVETAFAAVAFKLTRTGQTCHISHCSRIGFICLSTGKRMASLGSNCVLGLLIGLGRAVLGRLIGLAGGLLDRLHCALCLPLCLCASGLGLALQVLMIFNMHQQDVQDVCRQLSSCCLPMRCSDDCASASHRLHIGCVIEHAVQIVGGLTATSCPVALALAAVSCAWGLA